MILKNYVLAGFLLLMSVPSFALKMKVTDIEAIMIDIQYGEKKSVYLLNPKQMGGEASFLNGVKVYKPIELSQKNWEFILSQVEVLEKLPTEGFKCPRSSIEIQIKRKKGTESRSSCIESRSVLGQKLKELSDLLVVLF